MPRTADRGLLRFLPRQRRSAAPGWSARGADPYAYAEGAEPGDHAGRVRSDLSDELPEADLTEDLEDALALYEMGSKPRCEEAEYLRLVEDARYRIEEGPDQP